MNTNRRWIISGLILILFCLSMFSGCEKSPEESLYPYGEMNAGFQFQKGLTEGVPEKTNIGIELEGLTADDVSVGDKIVLR